MNEIFLNSQLFCIIYNFFSIHSLLKNDHYNLMYLVLFDLTAEMSMIYLRCENYLFCSIRCDSLLVLCFSEKPFERHNKQPKQVNFVFFFEVLNMKLMILKEEKLL